jgi:phage FluMu gp28-like protein
MQEYEIEYLSDAQNYIPIELILDAEKGDIGTEELPDGFKQTGRIFMGLDIGRKSNRTVICLLEQVEDLLIVRALVILNKMKFDDQRKVVYGYMDNLQIYKCCVDCTGMGTQFAEEMVQKYGEGRVEPINFTLQSKDVMYSLMKKKFEEHLYRIPSSHVIRADINGIKKSTTKAGNLVYTAAETAEGHSDRANALSLATLAGNVPAAGALTKENFIGQPRAVRVPNVPDWEARDFSSLFGGGAGVGGMFGEGAMRIR